MKRMKSSYSKKILGGNRENSEAIDELDTKTELKINTTSFLTDKVGISIQQTIKTTGKSI